MQNVIELSRNASDSSSSSSAGDREERRAIISQRDTECRTDVSTGRTAGLSFMANLLLQWGSPIKAF